jgi:two-component system, NtrC family, sensor kinase
MLHTVLYKFFFMVLKSSVSDCNTNLVELGILPMMALSNYFNLEEITTARNISAALINVSGRQRMLSQRTAFFCLRLVGSQQLAEREQLRADLLSAIAVMEKSHMGLINTDNSINLLSPPSPAVKAMYFEAPLYLDKQIRQYIDRIRALVQIPDTELSSDNPHLIYIVEAASGKLLAAFDAVVNQYQHESEIEQFEIDLKQVELYQESCTATAVSEAQAAELNRALYELKEAQSQLLHKEKMSSLGELMASIVHEINNPVSFIYGNLSHAEIYIQDLLHLLRLYQEEYPNPCTEIQDQIEEIELNFLLEDLPKVMTSMQMGSNRINEIVQSMQNFSRRDNSDITLCDLHKSIDTTLSILQNRLKPRWLYSGIEVIKEYAELPPVECYSGQLNQVFMNLISNAIDALEEVAENRPDALLRIFIRTELVGIDRVKVRIADTGSGMSAPVKERIFEQFFTTKKIGKGTGLGLAIVHKILVENHGGILYCESEPGKGTEFIVELPVEQS